MSYQPTIELLPPGRRIDREKLPNRIDLKRAPPFVVSLHGAEFKPQENRIHRVRSASIYEPGVVAVQARCSVGLFVRAKSKRKKGLRVGAMWVFDEREVPRCRECELRWETATLPLPHGNKGKKLLKGPQGAAWETPAPVPPSPHRLVIPKPFQQSTQRRGLTVNLSPSYQIERDLFREAAYHDAYDGKWDEADFELALEREDDQERRLRDEQRIPQPHDLQPRDEQEEERRGTDCE